MAQKTFITLSSHVNKTRLQYHYAIISELQSYAIYYFYYLYYYFYYFQSC